MMDEKEGEVSRIISNFEINEGKNKVIVFINPKIFPVPLVNKAASLFKENCWVTVDGDVQDEMLVELRPKKEYDLETLGREFNNQLLEISTEGVKVDDENPALLAKVRKVIKEFVLEEKGRISKQSIVAIGALLAGIGLVGLNVENVTASHLCNPGGEGGCCEGGQISEAVCEATDGGPSCEGGTSGEGEGEGDGDGCCCYCFPAGTKVTMADESLKDIEDVKVNDFVLAYDLSAKKPVQAKVLELDTKIREGYYKLNGNLLRITDDHPILSRKCDGTVEWAAINREKSKMGYNVPVNDLCIGEEIFTLNGWVKVSSLEYVKGAVRTYTIKDIEGSPAFFAESVMVLKSNVFAAELPRQEKATEAMLVN